MCMQHLNRCRASLLRALSHRKKSNSAKRRRYLSDCRDSSYRQRLGSFYVSDSPPYCRRHSLPNFEVPVTCGVAKPRGSKPISNAELNFADCLELVAKAPKKGQQIDSPAETIHSISICRNDRRQLTCTFSDQHLPERTVSHSAVNKSTASTVKNIGFAPSIGEGRNVSTSKMKSHSGKKPVRVHLLTGESILLVFDGKACVKEVFDQICRMYSIKESHFFGLTAIIEREHRFMDPKQRLSKYAPKEWGKEPTRRGSDLSVQPSSVFSVQFQVQFYVEHPKLICDEQSRYHYYLQLKRNVLQSKVTTQDEIIFTLAAIALHLDLGPFNSTLHTGRYFDPGEYVPTWFMEKWNDAYLWSHLPTMHAELVHTSPFNAQADYIKQASCIDDVPVHYYKLFKTKKEVEPSVILGVFHQGIRIHHVAQQRTDGTHILDFEFPWGKVGRLFFAAKRFEIYPEDLPSSRKLTYYTGSRTRSKYLLRLLRETHSLYMSLSPFVQHMRIVDVKNNKRRYRESYISGMNLEERLTDGVEERLIGDVVGTKLENKEKGKRENQFKSYNSSTSHGSSHTSGIESDSKQRPEEVEDEGDDNAFTDDYDPIDIDAPSSGGMIYVTQEHIEGPRHKSLSVTDLTDKSPTKPKPFLDEIDNATSSGSETRSEHTVRECAVAPIIEQVEESKSDDPEKGVEVHTCDNETNDDKILLNTHTMPSKLAKLKDSGCREQHNSDEKDDQNLFLSNMLYNLSINSAGRLNSSEGSPPTIPRKSASIDIIPSAFHKPVKSNHFSGRQGSKTFYDDTHTIFCDQGSEIKSKQPAGFALSKSIETSSSCNLSRESEDKNPHNRLNDKCVSECMHRTLSTDSALRQNRVKHRKSKSRSDESTRHQRHHSTQDGQVRSPDNDFPALSTNKSVEDLTDTGNLRLSRSNRQRDIPHTFWSDIPQCLQQQNKTPLHTSYSNPTASTEVSGTDFKNLILNHRKISDVCHQTIAAQHQKASDNRRQHRNHRRRSDVSGLFITDSHKTNNSALGQTPKKVEVLLRSKHELRPRPVSYHVASEVGVSPNSRRNFCFSDMSSSTRPNVYIENYKEVIV